MIDDNNLNTARQNSFSQTILANDRVHVWSASLNLPTVEINQLANLLSLSEIARKRLILKRSLLAYQVL